MSSDKLISEFNTIASEKVLIKYVEFNGKRLLDTLKQRIKRALVELERGPS
jgi:hypothetical protein